MKKENEEITLIRHVAGSQLYGTNLPDSDLDIKEVYIPCARDIILGNACVAYQSSTGDSKGKNTSSDTDVTRVSLQKFLQLCSKGDVGSIETMFADSNDSAILYRNDLWEYILENRAEIIGTQLRSAMGYIKSQTNKYIVRGDRTSYAQLKRCLGCIQSFGGNVVYVITTYNQAKYCAYLVREMLDSFNANTCFQKIGDMKFFPNYILFSNGSRLMFVTISSGNSRIRGIDIVHAEIDHDVNRRSVYDMNYSEKVNYEELKTILSSRIREPKTADVRWK